jgi:hypothetical protein
MMRVLAIAVLALGAVWQGPAAVYQYSVPVGERRAYLWIPPQCAQVRGVVIALENLLERDWLEDPIVREAASWEGLGIVWVGRRGGEPGVKTALGADMGPGAGEALEGMLKDLAAECGYPEIASAPIIATGHSANGQFAWNVARWKPGRTIAAIPVKTVPLPPWLDLHGVPLCYLIGETTEWPQYRDGRQGDRDFFWPVVRRSALALRAANETDNRLGVVTDPGGGHFDWSEHQARFLALYIRKACRYRLAPAAGWLTDTGGMKHDRFAAAPYRQYQGDPKQAYWFFDEETARAAVAFEGDRQPRKRQMPTFVQDGRPLPVAGKGYAALAF